MMCSKHASCGWINAYHIMMTSSNGNIIPRCWPFFGGIHRSTVNSPLKDQWRRALMFPLICAWNGRVNNRDAGDLKRHRDHYDVTVMCINIAGWATRTCIPYNGQNFDSDARTYSKCGGYAVALVPVVQRWRIWEIATKPHTYVYTLGSR